MDSMSAGSNVTEVTVRELRKYVKSQNRSACAVKSVSVGAVLILFCSNSAEVKHCQNAAELFVQFVSLSVCLSLLLHFCLLLLFYSFFSLLYSFSFLLT
jgi:hypothetical protein